uniref:NADH dehydrogenase [ubiquinone] flavoprotein 3, mitochondrial n=1 Tax=Steinernema glaseri TaxID=37863 RepID=A0A1I7ZEN0_9BILA
MFLRVIARQPAFRRCFSAAPPTSSGIEHAIEFKKIGGRHQQDFKDYKCSEYLHFNTYSYYNAEIDMLKMRVPQPTNKKPDVLPSIKKSQ